MTEGLIYSEDNFRVWVMVPVDGDYWVDGEGGPVWTESFRLVPQSFALTAGSKGSASFALQRATYIDSDGQTQTDSIAYVPGMYVCIARGDDAIPSLVTDWIGEIEAIDETLMADGADGVGTVRARELGYALYDIALTGWKRQLGGDTSGVTMPRPPTANVAYTGGQIWGNAVLPSGGSVYQFADNFNDLGQTADELWTPTRLLQHAISYCLPDGIAPISLVDNTDGEIDTINDEVWEIEGLTFGQLLDLVVPRSRGFDWKVTAVAGTWYIAVYGTNENLQTPTDVTLGPWATGVQLSRGVPYDQVIVRGQPIVWAASASIASVTMEEGWTSTLEDAFLIASGAADADEAQKFRKRDIYRDVFCKFSLLPASPQNFLRCDIGTGSTNTAGTLCLNVQWDGTTATIGSTEIGPDFPSARMLTWTPITLDYPATGWDDDPSPKFRPPKAYCIYDSAYVDLTVPYTADEGRPGTTPAISVDDRSPAIRIEFPYQEQLSYDSTGEDIAQPSSGTTNDSAIEDQIADGNELGFYSTTMLVTFAVESGQYLEVTKTRDGVDYPRRILRVERKDLGCWVMRQGCRYGTGASDRATANVILRNDYPKAETIATQLAAFAFQARNSASIEFVGRANADWAVIGTVLGDLTYGDLSEYSRELNTVITSVSCDCARARWTVTTDYPQMPMAPVGGGVASVQQSSPQLSGPIAKATARNREASAHIEREAQGRVLVPAMQGAGGGGGGGHYDFDQGTFIKLDPAGRDCVLEFFVASDSTWSAKEAQYGVSRITGTYTHSTLSVSLARATGYFWINTNTGNVLASQTAFTQTETLVENSIVSINSMNLELQTDGTIDIGHNFDAGVICGSLRSL
jgi:hypothetical protein